MPLRANTKSPGEFIRDHLVESPGQRDFIGAMFRRYKNHLQGAGVVKLPCRQTFSTYIYLLKETGAVVFDGAEAVAFGGEEFQPEALPVDYVPACGMPAPRHYYRLTEFDHPAFLNPKGVWRQARGLPAAVAPRPRPLPAARLIAPVAEAAPAAEEAPTAARGRRRRLSRTEALLEEGRGFIPRLEALRSAPPAVELLSQLEEELLEYFDQVVDAAASARGDNRRRLNALGGNVERAAEGFEKAREALDQDDPAEYQAAIDQLVTCCVGVPAAAPPIEQRPAAPPPIEQRPAAPPPIEQRPAAPPPIGERPDVPTITLPANFSTRTLPRLMGHLEQLVFLAEEADWPEEPFPELAAAVERLFEKGGDWRDNAQDSLDNEEGRDFPIETRLEALQARVEILERYVEALDPEGEPDLADALEALGDVE